MKPSKEENIFMDVCKNPYGRSLSTLESVWNSILGSEKGNPAASQLYTKR